MMPPAQDMSGIAATATLAFVVLFASSIWLSTGRIVPGSEKQMPLLARPCGSATLLVFSAVLTLSAF
ncbi:hypothetical protein ACU8NW_26720 (plasmid) [Rhizobium leguminosarum]